MKKITHWWAQQHAAISHFAEWERPRVSLWDIHGLVQWLRWRITAIPELSREKQVILEALNRSILWQEDACEQIAERLDTGLNRLMYKKGPLWVVFLAGPTGVGKTESVRVLAKALLWDENAYTRINCEQFQQDHTSRDLFGAPKSYVGYGHPTPLAEKKIFGPFEEAKKWRKLHPIIQWKRDFWILLFDEIEKAHPDIRQALLALLDDGKVTFPNNTTTSFENIFIVMTSNVWERELSQTRKRWVIWFQSWNTLSSNEDEVFQKELEQEFSPEFLGRTGQPIKFRSIGKEHCKAIIERVIEEANEDLAKYFCTWNIHIGISPQAIDELIEKWFHPSKGARPLMKVIETYILAPTNKILRKHAHEKFLNRKNPTVLYYDMTDGEIKAHFYTPDIIREPNANEVKKEVYVEPTVDRVDEMLSIPNKIRALTRRLWEEGFNDEEIAILMRLDKEYTLTSVFEAENFYDSTNLYRDAHVFGDNFSPRWIKWLIQRKAKEIEGEGMFSLHIFILMVIVKSISTIQKLLDQSQLSQEQENIVIRFAVVSAYKAWGTI